MEQSSPQSEIDKEWRGQGSSCLLLVAANTPFASCSKHVAPDAWVSVWWSLFLKQNILSTSWSRLFEQAQCDTLTLCQCIQSYIARYLRASPLESCELGLNHTLEHSFEERATALVIFLSVQWLGWAEMAVLSQEPRRQNGRRSIFSLMSG